ncbi:cyclic diguanylate phosphodiesterase [Vibrio sp. S17_S38]|uniref:EAL domain-containing protein n=1 Tax=Vibrio sp. S17_S38 TaxID=2720229 RepID=UPI0016802E5B|nr:EAL domain-containing protein [Vibrio sp. S17_S38]MBD1572163.1 cyclic diguanylate phosphodiesterase [Vibrio sp. S17_S38]
MPNTASTIKKRLIKKILIILLIPLPIALFSSFHFANISLQGQLRSLAQSYVHQMEEIVNELRDENKQALYDAKNCEQIQKSLLFETFLREMLISDDGHIVCSSKRGYEEYSAFSALLPRSHFPQGEYLFDFSDGAEKVRSLIVVDIDKHHPQRSAISIVDQRYIDVRLGFQSDDRISHTQMTVNKVNYPKGSKINNAPFATSAISKYLDIQVTITPSNKLKHDIFILYYLSAIPIWLLLAILIYLIQYWYFSRGTLIEDLKRAVKHHELHLVYQPLLNSSDKKISAVEALLRWENAKHGNVPPDIFIPLAEQHGFINTITDFVLEQALNDWEENSNHSPIQIGINVPPSYLLASDCIEKFSIWVQKYQEKNLLLGIEITERQLLNEKGRTILDDIRQLGIEVFIDDFGTGHTSLSILQDIQFDYLKIDRCFINSIGVQSVNTPVLNSIINLAHQLNVKIVAEGVETKEQMDYLIEHDVELLQGYYFYKPMTFSQLKSILFEKSKN